MNAFVAGMFLSDHVEVVLNVNGKAVFMGQPYGFTASSKLANTTESGSIGKCRWTTHKQAPVTLKAISHVANMRPTAVVWENVQGFGYVEATADKSPMQMVLDELKALGYNGLDFELCSSSFTALVRKRSFVGPWGDEGRNSMECTDSLVITLNPSKFEFSEQEPLPS